MNILVYTPISKHTPHFETSLEIIENHLHQGDKVTALKCFSSMAYCEGNPWHQYDICMKCISKCNKGFSLLSEEVVIKDFLLLTDRDKLEIFNLSNLDINLFDIDKLQNFHIDNFDIGYGVLSSLISMLKDPEPDLHKNSEIIKRQLITSLTIYRSIQNHLDKEHYDRVYLYNGRFASFRPVLRACQSKTVDCTCFEIGSSIHKYTLYHNTFPHDPVNVQNEIEKLWTECSDYEHKKQTAESFYYKRAKGIAEKWYSYTDQQHEGLLPDSWDKNKKNIVIFTSSEDEYKAIGDIWKLKLYKSQLDGIYKISESIIEHKDEIDLYVRLHPTIKNKPNQLQVKNNKGNFIKVIDSDSPISSYSLLKQTDIVITFGSTIGIEAVFWNKPSILLGMSLYNNLEGTYNPTSHAEAIKLILSDIVPKNMVAALKFGYYMSTHGYGFKHFEASGVLTGKFKGTELASSVYVNTFTNLLNKIPFSRRILSKVLSLHFRYKTTTSLSITK